MDDTQILNWLITNKDEYIMINGKVNYVAGWEYEVIISRASIKTMIKRINKDIEKAKRGYIR